MPVTKPNLKLQQCLKNFTLPYPQPPKPKNTRIFRNKDLSHPFPYTENAKGGRVVIFEASIFWRYNFTRILNLYELKRNGKNWLFTEDDFYQIWLKALLLEDISWFEYIMKNSTWWLSYFWIIKILLWFQMCTTTISQCIKLI